MVGKMYEARKNAQGGTGANQHTIRNKQTGQFVHSATRENVKAGTAGEIGKEVGMDGRSVRRAEKFAKGVDAIREVSPEAADKVLNGKAKVTKADIQEIGTSDQGDVEAYADAILNEMSISSLPTAKKVSKVRVKTPEDLENLQKIEAIVADMYDPTTAPEFTIDLLIDDIEVNAEIYVELLANTLKDRQALVTDENKPRIVAAINKVVENILKVRDSM